MAVVTGILGTSHAPSIAHAWDHGQQQDPRWRPLFEGYRPARAWLEATRPDAAVIFYNDHLNSLFFDRYPTFAIGVAPSFPIADEGVGRRNLPDLPGDPDLGWHLAERLVGDGFDMTVCQELAVDHGVLSPAPLLWDTPWPVPIVPIAVNVIQHPMPSAARCFDLGRAVRRALDTWRPEARPEPKVVVLGTGGLSHQTSGPGFGWVNPDWDRTFLDLLETDPEELTRYSHRDFIRLGGAESVEVILWIAMRGALGPKVRRVTRNYYAPMLTGYGLLVLEEDGRAQHHARNHG